MKHLNRAFEKKKSCAGLEIGRFAENAFFSRANRTLAVYTKKGGDRKKVKKYIYYFDVGILAYLTASYANKLRAGKQVADPDSHLVS